MGSKVRGQRKPFKQYVQHFLRMPVLAIHTPAKAAFSPLFCQLTALPGPLPTCSAHCPTSLFLGPQTAQEKLTSLRHYRTLICSLQAGSSKKCHKKLSSGLSPSTITLTTPVPGTRCKTRSPHLGRATDWSGLELHIPRSTAL